MEAIIFIGIQGVGKSTFYQRRFFRTHIRLNLDMLRTRHREHILLNACLLAKQPFVVDNTNPTLAERSRYIVPARTHHFRVVGYYFQSSLDAALHRNLNRSESERVPEKGIRGTYKRLALPTLVEGFNQLFTVTLLESGDFLVQDWADTTIHT
ncbi:MAG: ATP-binding protein [Anaerolineae bacterium]|nr:ATP-binding protein [Anaerolineae bacterium]